MSITNAIHSALSGLRATGRQAEVTAGNLANALTPGYGRQSVVLGQAVLGGQGAGVNVISVERALDPELTAARRIADGELADQSSRFDGAARLERALGTTGDPASLFNRIKTFEQSLRDLAETPESAPRQRAAADAARDLADQFNSISTETTRIRQSADGEIKRQVELVNSSLEKIARLNRQIQIFSASGRDAAALVDERERLIDQVSQNIPIRENRRQDGVVEVRTMQGLPLVELQASQVEFTPTPVMTPYQTYDDGAGALGGLRLAGVDITPGGSGAQAVQGGQLAGLFALRDEIAPEFQARADSLAADLIARVTDPAVDPTLGPGDPGLFTDDGGSFDPLDPIGIAGRIRLNAAADPRVGGDPALLRDGLNAIAPGPVSNPTIPRALLDALSLPSDASATPGLAGNLSFAGRAAGAAELAATGRVAAEAEVSALGAAREALAYEEAGQIGVDSDAELQQLIQIEQAYAANAQVIQTAARMLDELRELR